MVDDRSGRYSKTGRYIKFVGWRGGRYSKTSRYIKFVGWWSQRARGRPRACAHACARACALRGQRQILQDESLYKLRLLVVTAADTPRRVAI